MRVSFLFDYRIWITIILSASLGWFWSVFTALIDVKPVLMLAIPFAVLFFLLMVTKPRWVIFIIVIIRPLLDVLLNMTRVNVENGEGLGIGAVFNLTVIFLAIFLAFYSLNFPQNAVPIYCWVFYLLCMLITVFYSPSRGESIRLWLNYVSYFALFLIPFLIVKDQQDFNHWLRVLGISFVLPVLCADVDLMKGGQYFEDAGNRVAGTFTHPNILAFYLVLAFTFFFYLLKSGHLNFTPMIKWMARILMVNMLVLLVATKTRNAWISIYLGFVIYSLLQERKMLLLLVIIVPLMFLVPQVQERMLTVLKNDTSGDYRGINSFEWRMQMWKSSFSKIAQRPLQGYGLGSFKSMSEEFSTNKKTGAHNTYLELIFETGAVGLVSFISLFLSPLTIFFKNMRQSQSLIGAQVWALLISYVLSYMLICSADNLLFYLVFNWYVWFLLGLMLVASYRRYSVYV